MSFFRKLIIKKKLFRACFTISSALHLLLFASILLATLRENKYSSADINRSSEVNAQDMDVDISEIPPEFIGGDKDPAKIEKSEWKEGGNRNAADAPVKDENINTLSGSSEDGDGFLFSVHGDRPPTLIIRFNVKDFFPLEAKLAKIRQKTVLITVQVNEDGRLKHANIASEPACYGFDEAALKIVRLAEFRPGYVNGNPVKMNHTIKFKFELE